MNKISKTVKSLIYLSLLVIVTSCSGTKIYTSADAKYLAMNHEKIAIIPPKILIQKRKDDNSGTKESNEKGESFNIQQEIKSWLLKRKSKGQIFFEIQDPETTNIKLERAGYFKKSMTKSEMCKSLKVDAIIGSSFGFKELMSNTSSILLGVVTGGMFWGSTNSVDVNMEIFDKKSNKVIWNYNRRISGSIGSNPTKLIDYVMKKASKKMPHYKLR